MRAETVVTTACSARLNQMGKVWGQKCMKRRAVLNMSWQSMMSRSAKETVVLAPGCTLGGVRQLTHLHLGLAGGLSCSGSCALAAGCCPPLCGAGICCLNLPAQLHCVPLLGLSSPLCLQWVSLFLLAMPCLQWAHSGPTSLSLCPRHGVREKNWPVILCSAPKSQDQGMVIPGGPALPLPAVQLLTGRQHPGGRLQLPQQLPLPCQLPAWCAPHSNPPGRPPYAQQLLSPSPATPCQPLLVPYSKSSSVMLATQL